MNVRAGLVGLVAVILMAGFTSSTDAVTVFFDDFNSESGSLTGQTASSGQTWLADPHSYATGALNTGTQYGQAGTIGAGFSATSTVIPGNQVQFTPAGADVYKISVDFERPTNNAAVETDFELATATKQFTLIWYGTQLRAGGNLVAGGQFINTGLSTGSLHAEAILDLVTKLVSMSYYEIGNPSNNGSKALGDYGGTFAFDRLTMEAQLPNGFSNGFDNASITTVEPVLGDYNGNNIVDAADYVVWRKNYPNNSGTATVSMGDGTGDGNVLDDDYDYWRNRFGNPNPGSGSALGPTSQAAVPEPSAFALMFSALCLLAPISFRHRAGRDALISRLMTVPQGI